MIEKATVITGFAESVDKGSRGALIALQGLCPRGGMH
jgi:hypothetical protein